MADPLRALAPIFRAALARAFGNDVEATDPALRPSAHADYQANVALGLAKRLRRAPRDVAQAIDEALKSDASAAVVIERTEIAGPGFINVWLKNDFLSRELRKISEGELGLE